MEILVFAPHNDDEVLGVGGTIARHVNEGDNVYVCSVTVGKNKERTERIRNEASAAHEILGVTKTFFLDLPVVELANMSRLIINEKIDKITSHIKPDIIYIPHKGDMHTDHTIVAESVMVAARPVDNPQIRAIYAYETLSETEWNIPSVDNAFIPNVWSDITDTLDKKLKAMNCYQSQLYKFPHPRSLKAISSLSEFRGSTVCVNNAESFMLIRQIHKQSEM